MTREKGLPLLWSSHLQGEEAEAFKKTVMSSSQALGRLKEIIRDKLDSIEATETTEGTYEAGWEFRQAFLNGRRAGLREVDQLLLE